MKFSAFYFAALSAFVTPAFATTEDPNHCSPIFNESEHQVSNPQADAQKIVQKLALGISQGADANAVSDFMTELAGKWSAPAAEAAIARYSVRLKDLEAVSHESGKELVELNRNLHQLVTTAIVPQAIQKLPVVGSWANRAAHVTSRFLPDKVITRLNEGVDLVSRCKEIGARTLAVRQIVQDNLELAAEEELMLVATLKRYRQIDEFYTALIQELQASEIGMDLVVTSRVIPQLQVELTKIIELMADLNNQLARKATFQEVAAMTVQDLTQFYNTTYQSMLFDVSQLAQTAATLQAIDHREKADKAAKAAAAAATKSTNELVRRATEYSKAAVQWVDPKQPVNEIVDNQKRIQQIKEARQFIEDNGGQAVEQARRKLLASEQARLQEQQARNLQKK